MEISKKNIAYKSANLLWNIDESNMTICKFFWSMVWAPIFTGFLLVILFGIIAPIAFLFGYRTILTGDEDKTPFPPIRMLTTKSGFLVRPIYFVLGVCVIFLTGSFVRFASAQFWVGAAYVTGGIGVLAILVAIFVMVSKSEVGKVTRAYIKAAKQKVCPFVIFTE